MKAHKLKINKEFAEKYNKRKEKEELQRLKTKYPVIDEDTSSSTESEDDDGKDLTNDKELCILKTIAALKSKDPRCYDPNYKFFEEKHDDDDDDDSDNDTSDGIQASSATEKKKKHKEKPMFLKDYERKVITEREGKLSDDESLADSEDEQPKPISYYEQQEQIRKSIQDITAKFSDDDDDENDFLTTKKLSKDEKKKKEEDYFEWLKGQKDEIDENLAKDLDPLKKVWMNPDLDESEKFLRDYILNQRYKDDSESDLNEDEILKEAEEDEKEFDNEELFATKVNFRFQEPDMEFIKSYPRTIGDSLRNVDNRRAEKRKRMKDRKLTEKQKEKEELKRLKNLKKKELLAKLEKLKHVTGNDSIDLSEHDLEDDFDPDKHDAVMEKLIGKDYQDLDADFEKPKFDNEDFDDDENWEQWYKHQSDNDTKELTSERPEPCCSNKNQPLGPGKQKSKKKSKFTEELEKLKQTFDPKKTTQDEYINEVLCRMDYEDKIGDVAFRFNYRNVTPCDYGLTVNEVLNLPDKELNAWASVKKMSQYRTEEEEHMDVRKFRKMSTNVKKKMNILTSLRPEYAAKQQSDGMATANAGNKHRSGSQKKRHEKNKGPINGGDEYKKQSLETPSDNSQNNSKSQSKKKKMADTDTRATSCLESIDVDSKKGKDQKKKKKHRSSVPTMSNDRLEAYGISQKKFKYVIQNKLHREMKNAKEQT